MPAAVTWASVSFTPSSWSSWPFSPCAASPWPFDMPALADLANFGSKT